MLPVNVKALVDADYVAVGHVVDMLTDVVDSSAGRCGRHVDRCSERAGRCGRRVN